MTTIYFSNLLLLLNNFNSTRHGKSTLRILDPDLIARLNICVHGWDERHFLCTDLDGLIDVEGGKGTVTEVLDDLVWLKEGLAEGFEEECC